MMRAASAAHTLLARLRPETVRSMELASWVRLGDAHRCVRLAGRPGVAIYLAGYVAEMTLKTACFRLFGQPGDPVAQLLGQVRTDAKKLVKQGTLTRKYGGHDLLFWLEYLRHVRSKRPLQSWNPSFDARLDYHVHALATVWSTDLRYQRIPARTDEAIVVIARAGWLVRQRKRLWR
jgi:hypothetical protein